MFIVISLANGNIVGFFRIVGGNAFSYTEMSTRIPRNGTLQSDTSGAWARAPNFTARLIGFRFPFVEGDRFTVQIDGAEYLGVGTSRDPSASQPVAGTDGQVPPPGSTIVLRLVAAGVVTFSISSSPNKASLHFSCLSHQNRVTTEGSMRFEGLVWTLFTQQGPFAEISGLSNQLVPLAPPIRVTFLKTNKLFDLQVV